MGNDMNNKTLCPLCGEGHLTPTTDELVTEYRGQQGTVALHLAECDVCGSEITGDADSRANKRAVLAFRKSVDGLMTGAEIRAVRERYGITQDQAARLFGGGPKAFSKYESDDVAHSEAMNTLLCLVRQSEDAFWELVALKKMSAELTPHKAATRHKMAGPVIRVELTDRREIVPGYKTRKSIPYGARMSSFCTARH